MEVRAARADEVAAARALTVRSWLATYAPLIGEVETRAVIAERHRLADFERQAATPAHLFLVGARGGALEGHAHAYPQDGLYLDRLHVEPGRKGSGVGSALLRAVEAAAGPGMRVWLEVMEGNDGALGFYRAMGYAVTGRTEACGGLAGIPAIIMEKG